VATKRKTPPPPRRVQAPQRRTAPVSAETERRTRLILYGAGALGFVGLALAIALFTFGGGSDQTSHERVRSAMADAGGTLVTKPASEQGDHVPEAQPRSEYNSWPPTSGPHADRWAPYDVYTEPVEQYRLVHNLEHGGIVIQYGSKVPAAEVQEIESWYREDPNGLVIAPLPELGNQIALTVWTTPQDDPGARGTGVLAKLPRFDERAFNAFRSTYAFRGPERFPEELLTPGS
jgi:hypothetical protein